MKGEMIVFRVTNDEKENIEKQANLQNMTVSQLLRNILNNQTSNKNIGRNTVANTEVICCLLTEIQRLRQKNPDLDLDELERRASELCQW